MFEKAACQAGLIQSRDHKQDAPRLLLIYPATHRLGWVKYFQLPSLSLQQVAAITPANWEVTLVDESQDPIPIGRAFDLVGITAMTHQATRAYEIADLFRQEGVPVIMGGMHPTVMPDEALAHADAVVIGEAESVLATLLDDFLGGRLAKVYRAPIPQDDKLTIPWPRREILAGKRYLTTQTVQASRGCPYDCSFCTVTHYFGNRFRYRDPDDILAEIRSFPKKFVIFLDDNLLGDPSKARPILEGMAELGTRWGSQTSLRFAEDPEFLKLVARSGCIGLFVGIESVSGPFSHLAKSSGQSPQADLMKRVRDAGIIVEASFIFGFDEDDRSIFEKTLRFVEECSPSVPTFNLLTPYPGTKLFRQFELEGRLLHREWSRYNHSEVVFTPKQMSPEQLYRGWMEARKEAYTWPSILSRIWNNPGRRFTNLAYNILRKGPNDRLKPAGAEELRFCRSSRSKAMNQDPAKWNAGHDHA
ncbi:MAG: radical SAM protein [Deltaproteobacteria bacterium]|nr:radical SAM protein [Deltaproteobacteria bacterium]